MAWDRGYANFAEPPQREVPRIHLPRTPVNKLFLGSLSKRSMLCSRGSRYCYPGYNVRCPQSRGERRVDDVKRTPSFEEQAKAKRRKILDRLNSIDTGVSHYDMEQEEQRARGIDIARERERRPIIGT